MDLHELLPDFIDLVAAGVLIYGLFHRRHRRSDLCVVYAMFNLGLLMAVAVIAAENVSTGSAWAVRRAVDRPVAQRAVLQPRAGLLLHRHRAGPRGRPGRRWARGDRAMSAIAVGGAAVIDHPRLGHRTVRRTDVTLEPRLRRSGVAAPPSRGALERDDPRCPRGRDRLRARDQRRRPASCPDLVLAADLAVLDAAGPPVASPSASRRWRSTRSASGATCRIAGESKDVAVGDVRRARGASRRDARRARDRRRPAGSATGRTYLDTPDPATYREHQQVARQRFPRRAREYSDSGQLVFEVKLKGFARLDQAPPEDVIA